MRRVLYLPLDIFFYIIAYLPKPALYLLSDFMFFFIYHVFRYRRKTTVKNLKESFPEKSQNELKHIRRKFYRHLCDLTVENTALMKMSRKKITSFVHYQNPELLEKYYSDKKNVILVFGHYGNWEFLSPLPLHTKFAFLPVYKTVRNGYINKSFYKMRSIFGSIPVRMEDTLKKTLDFYKAKNPFILALIADQRPLRKNIQYWTKFMNQDTPVFMGPEKIGKKIDATIVFLSISKVKRGLYNFEFETLIKNSSQSAEHEITDLFIKKLENQIQEKPEYWLWTHDRWKHEKIV